MRPQWDAQQLSLVAELLASACARRQAELEVERGRQKLATMARHSTWASSPASLAHQLNQPLTGIRNHAGSRAALHRRGPRDSPQRARSSSTSSTTTSAPPT